MKSLSNKKIWQNTGCHETPHDVVSAFTKFISPHIPRSSFTNSPKTNLSILDLFAGDGRLGKNLGSYLLKYTRSITITFVEINDKKTRSINSRLSNFYIININVFEWFPNEKYDIVVTNPPYQKINSYLATQLGFSWRCIKPYLQNLYGLSIIKGLELCKAGGILAAIAPFSWLRGITSGGFRNEINSLCSNVNILAFNHRGLFKGTNQDIAFQIFKKRNPQQRKKLSLKFKYKGLKYKRLSIGKPDIHQNKCIAGYKIKIGPVVWNRKKDYLTTKKKNSVPLIYGGNIEKGKIDLSKPRYYEKQYISKKALDPCDISKPPFILIRRTLRGSPDNWKIDVCFIESKRFKCVAENHVIVIELPTNYRGTEKLCKKLIGRLKYFYFFSGSPSISVNVIKNIVSQLIKSRKK